MADVSQLEINGTTYNICDATARDSLSKNYLPLTAGSNKPLTGDLNIKSTNINRDGANPSSQQWGKDVKFIDKDNEKIGALSAVRETDGRTRISLYAYNENTSGSEQSNVFSMYTAKDGTQTYWVSSPINFRKALATGTTDAAAKFFRGDGELTTIIRNSYIITQWDNFDLTKFNNAVTTDSAWPAGVIVSDKNNRSAVYFGGGIANNGNVLGGMYAYNYDSNGTQIGSNYINAVIDKNGICDYQIANPANFRSTIGLGTVAPGTVLWTGGYYMSDGQSAVLSANVSSCPTGITLHWQAYANGEIKNFDHNYQYIPKTHVANYGGTGVMCILITSDAAKIGRKYLYIHNGKIDGNSNNTVNGTASGVTFTNNYWVLTQVIAS